MSHKPLSPAEVEKRAIAEIPEEIIETINNMLIKNVRNGRCTLLQKDILREIKGMHNIDSTKIFENGWLDFEPIYRDVGWDVEYDKPVYNEDYEAKFIFTKP